MPQTASQKFRIKEGDTLYVINAPSGFSDRWDNLPKGVTIRKTPGECQQVHWFVKDQAALASGLDKALPWVKKGATCWIYFPKGSSGVQTDLTRDKGWDRLLEANLQWKGLVSFDDTWAAFAVRQGEDGAVSKPRERPIFQYIDAAKKTIRLPEDFALLLNKWPREKDFFDSLSFTNKKEYVEWIVTAKRDETRLARMQAAVERLGKGWKNPANR